MQDEIRSTEATLGHALRQRRASQRLSLRALAQRTGYSPSFLSQVENGQSSPSISSISKITEALNVPLWEFFQALQAPLSETGPDRSSLASCMLAVGHDESENSGSSPFE